MIDQLPDIVSNIDEFIASLTIIFPGFLAYFTYIGLRAPEFEEIKRSHIILIIFFILFFQILQDLSGDLINIWVYQAIFFFIFPILAGAIADISHRIFVTIMVRHYQENVIDQIGLLGLVDVGNVSRWQKTVKGFVEDGLVNIKKEYYVEVEVTSESKSTPIVKRGFLNGYSEDDIELIRYDDLAEKDFAGIGSPDIDDEKLTQTIELIPRDQILAIRIYRVKMEDFVLE